jgi:hypothetical protein
MGLLNLLRKLRLKGVKDNPQGAGRNRKPSSKRKKERIIGYHRFISANPPGKRRMYSEVMPKTNGRHK